MPGEDGARFFIAHEQANILKNLQGGSMCAFDLLLREKGGVAHHSMLLGMVLVGQD